MMKPCDMKILVIGDGNWGKGETLTEALTNAKKEARRAVCYYIAYIIHPDTRVDDMGYLCSPDGFPPKEFHRVVPKGKKSHDGKAGSLQEK